ncbi:uncharacterized protein [Leptinotarsa decemlineata]|uniref:uncharacterized protein n=1 Tax=Leptinotarsa decemlineata TaxID=7539 RepID=UPI003D30AA47
MRRRPQFRHLTRNSQLEQTCMKRFTVFCLHSCINMNSAKSRSVIDLDHLRDNPDAIFDLLDEVGSDFEVDNEESEDDILLESENPTIAQLDSDIDISSERSISDESDADDPEMNMRLSELAKKYSKQSWNRIVFDSKNGPQDNMDSIDTNAVSSPWGYFSRYLGESFYELVA